MAYAFFQLLVNHFGLLKVKSEKGKNVCVAGVGANLGSVLPLVIYLWLNSLLSTLFTLPPL